MCNAGYLRLFLELSKSEKVVKAEGQKMILKDGDKKYKRVLAMSDIHGHFTEFMEVYKKINFTEDDLLIFLGDYIENGGEDLKMLRWLMKENKKENVIILCGNMEDEILKFFNKNDFSKIYGEDSADTSHDLNEAVKKEPNIIKEVYEFLKNLSTYFYLEIDNKKIFFCHAGIEPEKSFEEQDRDTLLWIRPNKFADEYEGDMLIVVGHTSVQKVFGKDCKKPSKIPNKNILLIDTGIKRAGYISCIDVLSGEIWQSD